MDIHNFITRNGLRPADAIVVKKSVGLLDHYVIYLGQDSYSGEHLFIANVKSPGVRIMRENEVSQMAGVYVPSRIRRFTGNEQLRREAVQRALNKRDKASYNLLFNNCEHFANEVQTGRRFSQQSQIAGVGLGVLALLGIGALLSGGSKSNDDDEA